MYRDTATPNTVVLELLKHSGAGTMLSRMCQYLTAVLKLDTNAAMCAAIEDLPGLEPYRPTADPSAAVTKSEFEYKTATIATHLNKPSRELVLQAALHFAVLAQQTLTARAFAQSRAVLTNLIGVLDPARKLSVLCVTAAAQALSCASNGPNAEEYAATVRADTSLRASLHEFVHHWLDRPTCIELAHLQRWCAHVRV